MPGHMPHLEPATCRTQQASGGSRARGRLPALLRAVAPAALLAQSGAAHAVEAGGEFVFSSTDVMLLAVFGGAMSFAILSATWLIRERGRMTGENQSLKSRIADLRASH